MESRTHHRRLFGRLGHRGRRRTGLRRDRHRHRRVGPGARRAMRRGRPETNLRTGQRPGRDSAFNFSRSRRADRTNGGGRGRDFRRHRRPRSPRTKPAWMLRSKIMWRRWEKISSRCASAFRRNSSLKIWTRRWLPRSITRLQGWLRWARKSAKSNCRCRLTGRCKAPSRMPFMRSSWLAVRNSTSRKPCAGFVPVRTSARRFCFDAAANWNRRAATSRAVFADVDVLVTPTTPIAAPAIAELKQNPDLLRPRELLLLRNTRPINVWGLPAISVPCGFTEAGLPIGLQIIGPHWGEARVLQVANAYEQATAWHKRATPVILSAIAESKRPLIDSTTFQARAVDLTTHCLTQVFEFAVLR